MLDDPSESDVAYNKSRVDYANIELVGLAKNIIAERRQMPVAEVEDSEAEAAINAILNALDYGNKLLLTRMCSPNISVQSDITPQETDLFKSLVVCQVIHDSVNHSTYESRTHMIRAEYKHQTELQLPVSIHDNRAQAKAIGREILRERVISLGLAELCDNHDITALEFQHNAAIILKPLIKHYLSDDGMPNIPHGPKAQMMRQIIKDGDGDPNKLTDGPDLLDMVLATSNQQKTTDSLGLIGEMLGLNVIQHNPRLLSIYSVTMNAQPQTYCDVILYNNGGGHFQPHINQNTVACTSGKRNDCGIHSLLIAAKVILQPEFLAKLQLEKVRSYAHSDHNSQNNNRNTDWMDRFCMDLIIGGACIAIGGFISFCVIPSPISIGCILAGIFMIMLGVLLPALGSYLSNIDENYGSHPEAGCQSNSK